MSTRKFLTAAVAVLSFPAFAADPPPDAPLVKRGDVVVTVEDFQAAMNKLPESERGTYRADLARVQGTVTSVFINRELAREAQSMGIDKEPEVQKRLQLLREGLLATIRMERFEKDIQAPDFEARAKELYDANPQQYRFPDKVKFRHILVSFQGRTHEEALKRAQQARSKLLANEPFLRVAREYSNDPTLRGNDGVIGFAPYDKLLPQLAQAAKTSPLNEVSQPIESSEGYHLIIVLEREGAYTVPFAAVRKSLIDAEQTKYRKAEVDKKLAAIVNSKEITMYTDNIAALKTDIDRAALGKLIEEHQKEKAKMKAAVGEKPAGK